MSVEQHPSESLRDEDCDIHGANDGGALGQENEEVTDAVAPEKAAEDAQKAATRHAPIKKRSGFFKKPQKTEIEIEEWDFCKLEDSQNNILAYFTNGPDPFDSTFFYKKAVVDYLQRRFPSDKPIRDVIDCTTDCLNSNNHQYISVRKFAMLAVPLATLFGLSYFGAFQGELMKTIAMAFLASSVLLFFFGEFLKFLFKTTIEDIGKDFHGTFQQFSNIVFNNFKEGLHRVDQDEHTSRPNKWPARARLRMVSSLWQSKRVEYAEKYLMVQLHTAKNGFRGMFGSELAGAIYNLLAIFLLGIASIWILNMTGVGGAGADPVSAAEFLPLAWWIFGGMLFLMFTWMFTFSTRDRFGQTFLPLKIWNTLADLATWGFIFVVALINISVFVGLNIPIFEPSAVQLIALNVGATIVLSFKSSIHYSIFDESIDAGKWRRADSFELHSEVGDQVYRDKCRIIDEKHRQKNSSHKPMDFDR